MTSRQQSSTTQQIIDRRIRRDSRGTVIRLQTWKIVQRETSRKGVRARERVEDKQNYHFLIRFSSTTSAYWNGYRLLLTSASIHPSSAT